MKAALAVVIVVGLVVLLVLLDQPYPMERIMR